MLCAGFEVWKCKFRGRRRESWGCGVAEVTLRDRHSTLCVLEVWDAWLRVVVEVSVAVTLGLACERVLLGRLESRNYLAGVLDAHVPTGLRA